MARAASYRANYYGTRKLMRSAGMGRAMEAAAEPIADRWRGNLRKRTGETAASVRVEGDHRSISGDRAEARIYGDSTAVAQEFGNKHMRKTQPARRALG